MRLKIKMKTLIINDKILKEENLEIKQNIR